MGCILYSQVNEVNGTVKDGNGVPLPGVNITVQNSDVGTQTDFDGNFTIEAEDGTTLNFSYVGFEDQKVTVAKDQAIDIVMEEGSTLDEVVVVGYGTQSKKDLTGSVSSVSSEDIRDIPSISIDEKLTGKAPGVQIKSVTGTPGGAPDIKIRGTTSIGASSNPLVVIDGMPMVSGGRSQNPLNELNPDDIETISILKDASSTAIYGSRGANGVILIETKRGSKRKTQFNLSLNTGIQTVPNHGRPDLMNARQFAEFQRGIVEDKAISRGEDPSKVDVPDEFKNTEMYGKGTNWYNSIMHSAPQQNINFSASGGTEKFIGYFSLGYTSQDGVIKKTNYERYSLRANLEGEIIDGLKVGLNLAPSFSKQRIADVESDFVDIYGAAHWLNPIEPIRDEEGQLIPFIEGPGLFSNANPLLRLQEMNPRHNDFAGLGRAFIEYEILEGFKAKYSYFVNYRNGKASEFHPSYVGDVNAPPPVTSTLNENRSYSLNQASEFLLTFDRTFNEIHNFDITAGFTSQEEYAEGLTVIGTEFPGDDIRKLNAAGRISDYDASVEKWSMLSYFGRLNYSLKDKYLLTATVRTDGSSRFGKDNRWGTFPSIGLGWQIDKESFMENSFMDELKLRVSYGLSGNFEIGNYTHIAQVQPSNYVLGGNRVSGMALTNLGNPDLNWEKSDEFDIGLEGAILNNRLNFSMDFYRKKTKDMLIDRRIPFSSGYGSATVNAGNILNRGVEFNIDSENLIGDFKWNTNVNISINRNKVLSLEGDRDNIKSGRDGEGFSTHITQVGKPIGQFYGFKFEGLYETEEDLENYPTHSSSALGTVRYKDVNGDGKIVEEEDFEIIGDPTPDFIFGITNSFSYKNFDLNIVIDGQYGGQIMKASKQFLDNIDGIFNTTTDVLDRWRSPSNPGKGKVPTTNEGRVLFRTVNSTWIEDATFLRFRNITLGYNLPEIIVGPDKAIQAARFSLSVQNAFTFTSYSGGNPQIENSSNRGGGSAALAPGIDFTSYPVPRTFSLGLDVSF